MYNRPQQYSYEPTLKSIGLKRMPELQARAYSFKDPLYQSFGNGYVKQPNIRHAKTIDQKNQIKFKPVDAQILQQAVQVSNKFTLLKSMLKISKPISSQSVLLVNFQNRIKTQTIIESNSKNEDQNSKMMCENAKKYLKFLDVINREEIRYLSQQLMVQKHQNDVKINLESRIQNESVQFSSQSQFAQGEDPHFQSVNQKEKGLQQNYQKKQQISKYINQNQSFVGQSYLDSNRENCRFQSKSSNKNQSFTNQDRSKYLTTYQKVSQITQNTQSTDQMFQRIQTPKIYGNREHLTQFFTPFQQNDPYQSKSIDSKSLNKKYKKFEKSPLSSAVLQTKNQRVNSNFSLSQNTHNQKVHRDFRIGQQPGLKNEKLISRQKSKSPKSINLSSFSKQQSKQIGSKVGKQKIKIEKDLKNYHPTKNLAMKVVDKTNQFEKMLRMTSSRMNPT